MRSLLLFSVVLLGLFFLHSANAAPITTAWSIFCAAKGDPTGAWEVLRFFPSTLAINQGDTITFICFHAHTVTFGNYSLVPPVQDKTTLIFSPYYLPTPGGLTITDPNVVVSTGFIKGGNFTFTFPNVGVFPFQCILHGTMTGTITVNAAGTPYTYTPDNIVANATAAIQAITAQIPGIVAAGNYSRTTAPVAPNANGKNTWTVLVGGGSPTYFLTYARYIPSQVTINVGDTVAFLMNDRIDIHITAFNTSCVYNTQDITINSTTIQGNPNYWTKTGTPTGYPTSSSFISSGVMPPIPNFYWNVTFTQPGTYCYVCSLHQPYGMIGNITVVAPSSSSSASSLSPFDLF